jgi:hypothetical protein
VCELFIAPKDTDVRPVANTSTTDIKLRCQEWNSQRISLNIPYRKMFEIELLNEIYILWRSSIPCNMSKIFDNLVGSI